MTDSERKIIRQEIKSRVFISLTWTLFSFLIVLLIGIFQNKFGLLFISLSVFSIASGLTLFIIISTKLRKDLKFNKIKLISKVLEDKQHNIDYEPGSATMPVTILSILTPKIFTREMKQIDIFTAWIDNEKYYITKEDFEKVEIGDKILVKRSFHSDIFLGLEKNN